MNNLGKVGAVELPNKDTNIIAKLEDLIEYYNTMTVFSEKLGVTKTIVSKWRNGHRPIPAKRVKQIEKLYAEAFSITPLLPHSMTSLNQWIMWCKKEVVNKETGEVKITKIPYRGNSHYKASSTNPNHWCKYDELPINDNFYTGIGLVIIEGLIFIDFDHVLNIDGTFKPEAKWAKELIEKLNPQYTEISPSGDGLHCFFKGKLPHDHRNKIKMGNETELEVYTKGRFSTITANPFNNSPLELVEISNKGIEALIEIVGLSSKADVVDTTSKSTVSISKEQFESILDDIVLLDSKDMSSIDFAFFKEYINARRLLDIDFVPTEEEMEHALAYKGMFELRKRLSNNPEKYTKHKTYLSSTIKKVVESIGEGFNVLPNENTKTNLEGFDEIFLDIATGKFVFSKGMQTFTHTKTNAPLLLPKDKATKILERVPRLIAEYNPTREKYFVNRDGLNASNIFKASKYVNNCSKDIQELPSRINFLLNHLIKDADTKKVFINNLANHLQNGTSIHTGWIFSGIEGAGKGTLMDIIFKVFGEHNSQKSKLTNFTGDKVKGIVNKLIGFIDESADSKIMYEVAENLKTIIANKSYSSRALGVNEVDVLNFTMYFFAVNSFGFKLSANDRRMNIIECTKKLSDVVDDLNIFHKELDLEIQNFSDYLMSYDVDTKLICKIVDTSFRQEMITNNLPLAQRIVKCIVDNSLDPILSECDEESEDFISVEENLNYIHTFDKVQGNVLSVVAKSIFELTSIDLQYFKKNSIVSLLKNTWVYKPIKMNGKTVKAYEVNREGDSFLTVDNFNERNFKDLVEF